MATPTPKLASKLFIFLSYRSVEARFADVLKRNLTNDFIGMVEVFLASDTHEYSCRHQVALPSSSRSR